MSKDIFSSFLGEYEGRMRFFVSLTCIMFFFFSLACAQPGEDDFFSTAIKLVGTQKAPNWQEKTMFTIVTTMVETGELERALEAAAFCEEGSKLQRSMSFAAVCAALIKKGDYERAFSVARDKIGFNIYKVDALIKVAEEFYKAGQSQWALKMVEALDNEAGRGYIFLALSNLAKGQQRFDEAFELAKKMGGGWRASTSLKQAAVGFAEAGRYDQAFALIEIFENPHNRAEALLAISKVLFKAKQKGKAQSTLEKSLETGEGVANNLNLDSLYADAAQTYAEFGLLEKAVEIAKKIKADYANQDYVFKNIALKYEASGDFETAKGILKHIHSVYGRENAFVELDLQHSNFDRSDEQLSQIQDPWQKLMFLVQLNDESFARIRNKPEYVDMVEKLAQQKLPAGTLLAEYYFKSGDKEKALGILAKTEESAQNLDAAGKMQLLVTTAFMYKRIGENQKAATLIKEAYKISEKDAIEALNRFGIWSDFISVLLEAEMPEDALKMAVKISVPLYRGTAQVQVARYYLNRGNYERAMEICQDIEWDFYKASFLSEMGLEYAKKGKKIGQIERQFFKAILTREKVKTMQ